MSALEERQLAEWRAAVSKLGREPEEWVGKKPDAMPSARVRDRILRTWGGRCYKSGIEIRPGTTWHADHVIPLAMGGMNAERNLRPILDAEHRKKTKAEAKVRAKADAQRRAANGTKAAPAKKIESAGFQKVERPSKIAAGKIEKLAGLSRRPMFVDDDGGKKR